MRRIILAGACALALSPVHANAGGVKEAVVTPAQVTQTAASAGSSAGGIIVPILLILILAATLSGGGSPT